MKSHWILGWSTLVILFSATSVLAQAFGEYGRAVGSLPHGPGITGSRSSGRVTQGNTGGSGGVGDIGGRVLPARLIVAKSTGLFPRQDEESKRIAQLPEGESLVPMVQAAGSNAWYMVKTSKGIIGWVKGSDVHEEKTK